MNSLPSSWKTEVLVEGSWASNALRFASEDEALMAGRELLSRWFVPTDYRAAASADPVNARMTSEYQRAEHVASRLEYLRTQLRAECISMDELVDLQSLAAYIDPADVELLEPAGVPEFTEDETSCSS
jgi:hypothetical protein